MQLPPCGMYLLAFDEFHWVAARDGRDFFISFNFYGALSEIVGGQPLLREDDDRSARRRNQEYSICFSSILCI